MLYATSLSLYFFWLCCLYHLCFNVILHKIVRAMHLTSPPQIHKMLRSVCLSVYLYVCLYFSGYLSLFVSLFLCLSVCLSISHSLSLSLSLSLLSLSLSFRYCLLVLSLLFWLVLSDSKSPHISRTLLGILTDFNSIAVCVVSILPWISNSLSFFPRF